MKKALALTLALLLILAAAGCGKQPSVTLTAKVLEIGENYFLVEPVVGSPELKSSDRIEVPMKNMEPSPEPQVGDTLEITYSGAILETDPGRLAEVYSIRVAA